MKTFTIEMNKTHMQVMTAALETLSRLLMGQVDIVFEQVPGLSYDDRQFMQSASRLVAFEDLPTNGSYGISNEKLDDRAKIAYEMKGVLENLCYDSFIRPELEMEEGFETMQHFDRAYREPLKVSEQPFIKITENKN